MRFCFVIFFLFLEYAFGEWGAHDVHNLLIHRTNQKKGVYTGKLESVMDTAGLIVVSEFHKVMGDLFRPTITSANDFSWHARYSKHYLNRALDFRILDVPKEKRPDLVCHVRKALGERFIVLWERQGTENEHLHVEYKN